MKRLMVPPFPAAFAAFEHEDDPFPHILGPVLKLEQLDLQLALLDLVLVTLEAPVVGIALFPGVDLGAISPAQDRLLVAVVDDELVQLYGEVMGNHPWLLSR